MIDGPLRLMAHTTTDATSSSARLRTRAAGARPSRWSRWATASAATITAMKPSPMRKPEWRLPQTRNMGRSSQATRPPRRRWRSARNSVRHANAKVSICARGPQIGYPAMTASTMPPPSAKAPGRSSRARAKMQTTPSQLTTLTTATMAASPPHE